ncbi:hypothetical protein B0H14DRAFT_2575140 [Mycena olivaceomarginata]|nr:hypothetical protein B0H14DRAFT_2575140 [Mycena olivaceomarginata]
MKTTRGQTRPPQWRITAIGHQYRATLSTNSTLFGAVKCYSKIRALEVCANHPENVGHFPQWGVPERKTNMWTLSCKRIESYRPASTDIGASIDGKKSGLRTWCGPCNSDLPWAAHAGSYICPTSRKLEDTKIDTNSGYHMSGEFLNALDTEGPGGERDGWGWMNGPVPWIRISRRSQAGNTFGTKLLAFSTSGLAQDRGYALSDGDGETRRVCYCQAEQWVKCWGRKLQAMGRRNSTNWTAIAKAERQRGRIVLGDIDE